MFQQGLTRRLRALVTILLLAITILTGCSASDQVGPLPDSPLLAQLERKSGLIAYVGVDGNIYTINQGGGNQHAITVDAVIPETAEDELLIYQSPLWSPDSQQIAFIGLQGTASSIESSAIFVANTKGEDLHEVYGSEEERPVFFGCFAAK